MHQRIRETARERERGREREKERERERAKDADSFLHRAIRKRARYVESQVCDVEALHQRSVKLRASSTGK